MTEQEFVQKLEALGFRKSKDTFLKGYMTKGESEVFINSRSATFGGGDKWLPFDEFLDALKTEEVTEATDEDVKEVVDFLKARSQYHKARIVELLAERK